MTNPPDELKERWRADAAKALAEAALFDEERRKIGIDADLMGMQAEVVKIERDRELYKRRVELARNEHNRVFNFSGPVTETSVAACINTLQSWQRMDVAANFPPSPIEIAFFSPGGDIINGFALFDFIQQVRSAGHYVTCSTIGYAASMAGILLQAGDHRVMGREAWMLIHEGSAGMQGSWSELKDRAKWLEQIQERMLDIYAERAKHSAATNPISRARLKKERDRTDFWVDAPTALKYGLIDAIREGSYPAVIRETDAA